jgi:hypothetical protein
MPFEQARRPFQVLRVIQPNANAARHCQCSSIGRVLCIVNAAEPENAQQLQAVYVGS